MPGEPYEPSWQDLAACAGEDADLFFPERGQSLEAARAICNRCVVKAACLQYALDHHEKFGVWGGTSERERRRLRNARRQALTIVTDPAA